MGKAISPSSVLTETHPRAQGARTLRRPQPLPIIQEESEDEVGVPYLTSSAEDDQLISFIDICLTSTERRSHIPLCDRSIQPGHTICQDLGRTDPS